MSILRHFLSPHPPLIQLALSLHLSFILFPLSSSLILLQYSLSLAPSIPHSFLPAPSLSQPLCLYVPHFLLLPSLFPSPAAISCTLPPPITPSPTHHLTPIPHPLSPPPSSFPALSPRSRCGTTGIRIEIDGGFPADKQAAYPGNGDRATRTLWAMVTGQHRPQTRQWSPGNQRSSRGIGGNVQEQHRIGVESRAADPGHLNH